MNHDDGRRAALGRAVAACRRALVGDRRKGGGDLGAQLEAPYGFDPGTGVPKPMDQMGHLERRPTQRATAQMLRDWHAHLKQGAAGDEAERARAAYDQMKYELGYTALHRLCALRMAEERTIVRECVRRGRDSDGFRMFLQLTGDSGLGTHEDAYAFFLARLYDELARDLPAVFDRRTTGSLVVPGPEALATVLDAINDPELVPLWSDDETLGWIFEDYNDADERREMREHDAPRNARELAVRNQFFTPRWVVEFLTDNTLGRLWYDLAGGTTDLAENCRFLLKPVEVQVQGCQDPRDLKILDPACGSGHFLLYVYDLLETMYYEAWAGRHHRSSEWKPLWEEFPDEAVFKREIPRLILAHNLYGVDIDPRCIQEAALALWLRAHRAWSAQGVRAKDRPRIAKNNLVCAQALSDVPTFREKLRATLKPAALGRLVDTIFLQVAEMGVLLRVESAIKHTVDSVKKDYLQWKRGAEQCNLFGEAIRPTQTMLEDFVTLRDAGADDDFWDDADRLIMRALDTLADEADDKEHYRSRLFAEDVRHGLEFFDVSRLKFDVILMNPPFGAASKNAKRALEQAYPNAGGDLYAMFYERALEMLTNAGRVGAITSRTWLGLGTLEDFRRLVIEKFGSVEILADLGSFVLNAQVEVAAAIMSRTRTVDTKAAWIRLLKTGRKPDTLENALLAASEGRTHASLHWSTVRRFHTLPACVYGYWMSDGLIDIYGSPSKLEARGVSTRLGAESGDDPRHLRLAWEVPSSELLAGGRWLRFAKGGDYRHFADDVHVAIRTRNTSGSLVPWRRGKLEWFTDAGVTWPQRTTSRLSARVLPFGSAFGHKGPAAQCCAADRSVVLSLLNSRPVYLLLSARLGAGDDTPGSASKSYEVGLVRDLPWPSLADAQIGRLAALTDEAVEMVRIGQIEDDDTGETVVAFAIPPILFPLSDGTRPTNLEAATRARVVAREDRLIRLADIQAEIDNLIADAYGFSARDRQVMDDELELPLAALPGTDPIVETQFTTAYLTRDAVDGDALPGGKEAEMDVRVEHRRKKQVRIRDEATLCRLFQTPPAQLVVLRRRLGLLRAADLQRAAADIVSYAVGVAFGRWDIRLWEHPEWIPSFADPFDPMPPCPLGQLVQAEGLPASEDRIASETWLAARRHPTILPEDLTEPREVHARAYPLPIAWNGLLTDDTLHDALPRRPSDSFVARVELVLEHLFGKARPDWEHELAAALGAKSIIDWLRAPSGFFADHLQRYSKSRRQAPIYWPLSTPSGGITVWVYAPRFDVAILPLIVNRIRAEVEDLRDARDATQKSAGADRSRLDRLALLEREIDERGAFRGLLEDVLRWGYAPHADDGFMITAAPLHFAFRLQRWRDTLKATWDQLVRGEYDWAHLAMLLRPTEVLAKCRTDRSLAIAHGKEGLFEAPEKRKRGSNTPGADATQRTNRAPRGRAKQTSMLGRRPEEDK